MRSRTTQGLVVGSFCLASFLLVGCEDGLALLNELKDQKGGGAVDPGKDPVDPGKPCVPPPATDPGCTAQVQGGDTSCKDVGVWKQYAWESCQAAGLVLTDYAPYQACGEGSFRFVKYTCCKPTTPPPPPPRTCETRAEGGDTSCKSVGTWKQYAGEDCAAAGLQLTAYTPVEACGDDSYRFVTYTCCK